MEPEEVPEEWVSVAMGAAFPLLQTPRDEVRLESAEKHTRAALAAVLPIHEEWIRAQVCPDEWAIVKWHPNEEDGGIATAEVVKTFRTLDEAESWAAFTVFSKANVARWDDNGYKSCWR